LKKWIPAISMMLVSLLSYIDRNTLAILAPTVLKETHLSAQQYGFIISCFSVAYTIGNPVWGVLLDRTGVRRGMSAAVALWTVASAAHALAGTFAGFGIARALLGFGEGATFPGGLRTVTSTLGPAQRGRGLGIAYSGGSLGAMLTPLAITPIALVFGWRGAFLATGMAGALWLAWWQWAGRGIEEPVKARAEMLSWRDRRVWGFMLAYALGSLPIGFILYSASLYLTHVYGTSQAQLGKVLWIPPLGWEIGYFAWGWLFDRNPGRSNGLLGTAAVLSLALGATPWLPGIGFALLAMFFAMSIAAAFIVGSIAYATRAFSERHAGLLAGLGAGAWGAAVAVAMPIFGMLIDRGRWDVAFAAAALMPGVGYFTWVALDRSGTPRGTLVAIPTAQVPAATKAHTVSNP
jgi:ACS family hexuronate transporter-like MFS transporter